jgi:hypothetical protein
MDQGSTNTNGNTVIDFTALKSCIGIAAGKVRWCCTPISIQADRKKKGTGSRFRGQKSCLKFVDQQTNRCGYYSHQ